MSANFEVELKFRVETFAPIEKQLAARNATSMHTSRQRDQYYRHPNRDFAETDEALRIRRTDDEVCITYKGPKLDAQTKTRQEIELPLSVEHDSQWNELLLRLGFSLSAEVIKTRREFSLIDAEREFHVALDEVADVGCFVEVETIAEQTALDDCRQHIQNLATSLGLTNSTRESYLGMLLRSRDEAT